MAHIEEINNGKFRITVTRVINGERKRFRKTVSGTPKQVEKAAIIFEPEVEKGEILVDKQNITVTQFAHLWMDKYVKASLKVKTIENYQYFLNKFIVPKFGRRKLCSIKSLNLITLYNDLKDSAKNEKLVSNTTVSNIHNTIHKMFKDAVTWSYLMKNSAEKIPKPKKII